MHTCLWFICFKAVCHLRKTFGRAVSVTQTADQTVLHHLDLAVGRSVSHDQSLAGVSSLERAVVRVGCNGAGDGHGGSGWWFMAAAQKQLRPLSGPQPFLLDRIYQSGR